MQMIRKHGLQVLALMMIALIITSCAQGPVTQVTTTPGKPPAKTRVTSEDLMLVDQLMLNRKFEEAVSKIQELQQIEPGNPALEEKLRQAAGEWKFAEAQNLMAVGAYGEAIKKIKSALDLIPQDQRMLYALDEAYLQLGMQYLSYLDAEKAREALNSVQYDQNMKLQAQSLLTTYVPAVEYTKQGYEALTNGNYTMALGYFKAALQLKPGLEQAANGQKAAEAMAQAQPSPTPGYTPSPGTSQPPGEGQITYPTPTPTEEVSTWEKPEAPSGVQDWSNFKSWMENEINRWMSGSSINENPLLGYQSLSLNEDPQAYNYLSESDFANTLYLSAIKIYGERALYIASEIPRLFPLPLMSDPAYQVTQKRIGRLNRAVEFISEGINGLKAPTIFKETHNKLLDLINEEKRVLNSLWYGAAFPPSGVGDLSGMSQAYVDAFDKAQAKTLSVPFSELPKWAQLKKYYIETGLYAYMLNEVARDFEDMLPLPRVQGPGMPVFSPAQTVGGITVQLKADNSAPKVGDTVKLTLFARNTTSNYLGAFIYVSLPPGVSLIDPGGGAYKLEDNQPLVVWENLQLPPMIQTSYTATTPTTTVILPVIAENTITKEFSVKVTDQAFGKTLSFKTWIQGFTYPTADKLIASSPYNSSGPISARISVSPSNPTPGSELEFTVSVVNGGSDKANLDITVPVPQNTTLVDMGTPVGILTTYSGLQALKWTGKTIEGGQTLEFKFKVKLSPSAPFGVSIGTYALVNSTIYGQTQGGTSNPIALPWVYFQDILRLDVEADKGVVNPKEPVTFKITAENTSPDLFEQVTIVLPLPANTQLLTWTSSPAQLIVNGAKALVWPFGPDGEYGLGLKGRDPEKFPKNQPYKWEVSSTLMTTTGGAITVSPYAYYHGQSQDTDSLNCTVSSTDSGSSVSTSILYYGPTTLKITASTGTPVAGGVITYTAEVTNLSSISQVFSLKIPLPNNTILIDPGEATFGQYYDQQYLLWPAQTVFGNSTRTLTFKVMVIPGTPSGTVISTMGTFDLGTTIQLGTLTVPAASAETPATSYNFQTSSVSATVSEAGKPQSVEAPQSEISVSVGTGAEPNYRSALDEVIRLVRYAEQLHRNLNSVQVPSDLNQQTAENLKAATDELASVLYWIPIKWAELSALPYEYFVGYPKYSSSNVDGPNAQSLFDPVTGIVKKDVTSFLTLSSDLTYSFGTPDTWKDMIEYLRAQLLQRLAELGYR